MPPRKLADWISAYMVFTDGTVSPAEYHKWTALSTIAGAVRRKVFFDMSYFLLYPNLYVVLVGPAGRCKKSTAMRIGRGMLSEITGVNFTTDSITRERLIQDLSQTLVDGHSSMTAYASEFASLLTSSGMDMVVFLTDIFDSPSEWSHKTKLGGTNKITGPYLNLEGATTPDWIAKAMPLDTVGIGLTSRIIFVYQDTPRSRPWRPVMSPEMAKLRKYLVEDLAAMSLLTGEYRISTEADSMYDTWYKAKVVNPNTTGDPRLNGYFERKEIHVLKVAMLVAASKRDELVITGEDMDLTFKLFDEVEVAMPKVFANVGKNPLTVDYDDVLGAIVIAGPKGLPFGVLMDMFKHSVRKDELAEVLETLIAANKVMVSPGGIYIFRGKFDE